MSVAAELVHTSPVGSSRLLADLQEFEGRGRDAREPVLDRLAEALGREFAEQIVAALSKDALARLDAALTTAFAKRLADALAGERRDVVDGIFGKSYAVHFPDGSVARWSAPSAEPTQPGEVITLNGRPWRAVQVVQVGAGGVDFKLQVEPVDK